MMLMLSLICTTLISAQEINLEKHPGYIDFNSIKIPSDAVTVTDIDLGPALLRLAGMMSEEADDELQKSLASLLSIRVKSFEIDENTGDIDRAMDRIEKKLSAEKWERLVYIRDGEERTNISLKVDAEKVVGFVLMSIGDDEVTFINVVGGNIDLDTIKQMGRDFDFEDRLEQKMERDFEDMMNWDE
jgi:hypothetical protein